MFSCIQVILDELDVKKVIAATSYVEKAETGKKQSDVTTAYKNVNALQDSADKTALLERLNAVQYVIDLLAFEAKLNEATTYVAKAEANKTEHYYNKAIDLANNLLDSPEKTTLFERLEVVRVHLDAVAINNASTAVVSAEKYKTQYYYDAAESLVSALPDSDAMTEFEARLAVITIS